MSTESNAQPAPAPAPEEKPANEAKPEVVKKKKKRHAPTQVNLQQGRQVEGVKQKCLTSQKPVYAPMLAEKGIAPLFVVTLLADIAALAGTKSSAIQHTTNAEGCTQCAVTAEETLTRSLRDLQGAGRQLHQHTNPEKLKDYLIGHPITQSRDVLDESASVILVKAGAERPPGVNTDVLTRVAEELTAFNATAQSQKTEQSAAQNTRLDRDAAVKSIVQRGQQLLIAADRAWPFDRPENAAARREFGLPATRPYVP